MFDGSIEFEKLLKKPNSFDQRPLSLLRINEFKNLNLKKTNKQSFYSQQITNNNFESDYNSENTNRQKIKCQIQAAIFQTDNNQSIKAENSNETQTTESEELEVKKDQSDQTNIQDSSQRLEDLSGYNYIPSNAIAIDYESIILSLQGVLGTLEYGEKMKAKYNIVCKLDNGSYGQVHCWQKKDDQSVYAVKIIQKQMLSLMKKLYQISNEQNNCKQLQGHQNIIKLYESFQVSLFYLFSRVFQDQHFFYMILEFVPNGQLYNLIKRFPVMSLQLVKFITASLINGIEFMHKNQIIHRDLKPQNIILNNKFQPVIIDFGSSKCINDRFERMNNTNLPAYINYDEINSDQCNESLRNAQSKSSSENGLNQSEYINQYACSYVGTEEYISPEIIRQEGCGYPSDIWSLGIILYQMLSKGHCTPFKKQGQTTQQILTNIQTGEFEFTEGFPEDCKDLIKSMLQIKPQQRITLKKIKLHAFFEGIDFEAVKKQSPPDLNFIYLSRFNKLNLIKEKFGLKIKDEPIVEFSEQDDKETEDESEHAVESVTVIQQEEEQKIEEKIPVKIEEKDDSQLTATKYLKKVQDKASDYLQFFKFDYDSQKVSFDVKIQKGGSLFYQDVTIFFYNNLIDQINQTVSKIGAKYFQIFFKHQNKKEIGAKFLWAIEQIEPSIKNLNQFSLYLNEGKEVLKIKTKDESSRTVLMDALIYQWSAAKQCRDIHETFTQLESQMSFSDTSSMQDDQLGGAQKSYKSLPKSGQKVEEFRYDVMKFIFKFPFKLSSSESLRDFNEIDSTAKPHFFMRTKVKDYGEVLEKLYDESQKSQNLVKETRSHSGALVKGQGLFEDLNLFCGFDSASQKSFQSSVTQLYRSKLESYDLVIGERKQKKVGFFKKLFK